MTSVSGIGIKLKSSLWFLPALCVLFAVGLALGLVELDTRWGRGLVQSWPRFFGLSAEGSRGILAVIAQSVITVAGVSFSITIVALSIAANQYTSRVLRNFMRDHANQAVLGGLVGIFSYCIIVLRTIHGGDYPFVPAVSVLVALVLAMVAVGLFIFFVHHVAMAIQASTIVCAIAAETQHSIRRLFPKEVRPEARPCELSAAEERRLAEAEWQPVPALVSGYLQSVKPGVLMAFARKHQTVLRMEYAIGDFVLENRPLVSMVSGQKPDPQTVRKLNRLFSIESYRTIDQDPAFGIRQIVDIAVKALSPGINDPATAFTCLDYLASILCLLILRHSPPRCQYEAKELRLVARWPSFESLINLAFNEIRQNSGSQPAVMLSLLNTIARVGETQPSLSERRRVLRQHTRLTLAMAELSLRFPPDLEMVRREAGRVEALLPE